MTLSHAQGGKGSRDRAKPLVRRARGFEGESFGDMIQHSAKGCPTNSQGGQLKKRRQSETKTKKVYLAPLGASRREQQTNSLKILEENNEKRFDQ